MTEEVRASHEEVEAFVGKLQGFYAELDDAGQEMLGTILESAQGGETAGYRRPRRRSGEDSDQAWNDLIGWIEEQGEEDTQGFIKRPRR